MSNGPRFFETRMGVRFFESDLPKLIKTLERIAVSLENRSVGLVAPEVDLLLNRVAAERDEARRERDEARASLVVVRVGEVGRPTSGPLTAADRCAWCGNVRAGDSHLCGACLMLPPSESR